jgi:hypothetical protein
MWTLESFVSAGYSATLYDQLKYITHDEEGHVVFLEAGLKAAGATPVAACTYSFPMTTPKEFITLASVIEGVGVSAYLGAAGFITEKAYLTAAGSILVTEALHQSTERNAIGEIPMSNVFGTPMGLNAVFTIASAFIVSCPSTNAALPVMTYPALSTVASGPTAAGNQVALKATKAPGGTFFATFVSGLNITPVAATISAEGIISATVPQGVEGQSYVFLTSDKSGNLTDANIIAGPAIIEATPSSPTFDITIT